MEVPMGKGVSRRRLSPLQAQLLRFLAEAGAEDVQTTLATFVRPTGHWTTDDIADAVGHLVRLGLVAAQLPAGTAISWPAIRDQLVGLPALELVLTADGRVTLTT
jgi:hypothetical protein